MYTLGYEWADEGHPGRPVVIQDFSSTAEERAEMAARAAAFAEAERRKEAERAARPLTFCGITAPYSAWMEGMDIPAEPSQAEQAGLFRCGLCYGRKVDGGWYISRMD